MSPILCLNGTLWCKIVYFFLFLKCSCQCKVIYFFLFLFLILPMEEIPEKQPCATCLEPITSRMASNYSTNILMKMFSSYLSL